MTTDSFQLDHIDTVTSRPQAARRLSQQIVPVRRDAIQRNGAGEEDQDASTVGLMKQQLAETTTELQTAQQRLLRSQLEIEKLAASMSHDLRTPLRAVAGFSQYLKQEYEGKLDETADSYINYVVDGATRMDNLIQGLVQYSRISSKALPSNIIDLNDLLADALAASENLTIDADTIVVDGDVPEIRGDYNQLTVLLKNLIDNGLKFNASESPKIQIQVQTIDDVCQISVCDNGIGIAPQYLECVFDLFRRLNVRSEFVGEGAGLAICRRIAERHLGSIYLESEEGVGTTATFSLPVA